jgi:hypothetical protein
MGVAKHMVAVGGRARYWFDSVVARGTPALIGWLALVCLVVVVPASAGLVWADRHAPTTASGRLTAVWKTVGQTLKIGGEVGPPAYVLLSVLLALVALLFVSALVGLITTGMSERIMALRLGRSMVIEERHTVLLGWSDQVFPIISELVAAMPTGAGPSWPSSPRWTNRRWRTRSTPRSAGGTPPGSSAATGLSPTRPSSPGSVRTPRGPY